MKFFAILFNCGEINSHKLATNSYDIGSKCPNCFKPLNSDFRCPDALPSCWKCCKAHGIIDFGM